MSCLICTVGIPASGKSEFCNILSAELKKQFPSHVVLTVCYDDLIDEDLVQAESSANLEWKNRRRLITEVVDGFLRKNTSSEDNNSSLQIKNDILCRNQIPNFKCSFGSKLIIILDDNFYYTSMRYEYYRIAKFNKCGFCQIYFQCDLQTALLRNESRKSGFVSAETIRTMSNKLEIPNSSRNRWEDKNLTIDSNKSFTRFNIESAIRLVSEAIENPVITNEEELLEEKETSRTITSMNVVHQVDVCLRKIIKQRINELDVRDPTKLKIMHEVKKDLMVKVKQGNIILPSSVTRVDVNQNHEREKQLTKILEEHFLDEITKHG